VDVIPRVRVLLAESQLLLREAMRVALSNAGDIEVVAEVGDGMGAVAAAKTAKPDVALIDAALPGRDGVQTTRMIGEAVSSCRIVVFGGKEDERPMMEALEAGASGYLTEEAALGDLVDATKAVFRGEALVPPRLVATLLNRLVWHRRERDEAIFLLSQLTRRERQVLAMLAQGANNRGIAEALAISPDTARTHIQNLLGKLGVHSRLEAAAFAARGGLSEDLFRLDEPTRITVRLARSGDPSRDDRVMRGAG
jgi:DNA-binding NarL/FixJ family response regulator